MTESTTRAAADVRVGSATDGLTPFSTAARSLAAGLPEWLALGAVALAAVIADQVTKHIVSSQLALDDQVKLIGPFSIHHVQNSGIAFGLFSSATAIVIVLTAFAVGWMILFFARSGSRHPVLPVALGLVGGLRQRVEADREQAGEGGDGGEQPLTGPELGHHVSPVSCRFSRAGTPSDRPPRILAGNHGHRAPSRAEGPNRAGLCETGNG